MLTGQRIKERRLQIGLSVTELANCIGKNRATVYRYESNDIGDFSLSILEPLANALHTTPAYLMGWADDPDVTVQTKLDASSERERDELRLVFGKLNKEYRQCLLDYAKVLLKAQQADEDYSEQHRRRQ